MAIDRRKALGVLAGGLAAPLLSPPLRAAAPIYLSARADGAGGYAASGFSLTGDPVFDLALPGRGHGFAVSARGIAVHFSRRSGRFALAIDPARGVIVTEFASPADRHFYGHGAFAPDGGLLYAAENDFGAARGVIGIYDADDGFARLGEIPSHGVGPHEIALLPDGATLAVANGGIATHPDLPRVKLNLAGMAPSLAYVDRRDGTLRGEFRLPPALHRLGIRHIAVGRDGPVAVAMQYEGPRGDVVPLVAVHTGGPGGGALRPLPAPPAVLRAMKQYCGSVAFDSSGRFIAASAPRGGLATFWDAGGWLSSAPVPDGSGVAPTGRAGEFIATGGRGGGFLIDARSGAARPIGSGFLRQGRWDNHLAASGPPIRPWRAYAG